MKPGFLLLLILYNTLVFAQWNNPHPAHNTKNSLHGAFSSAPKTLDPARSYSSDETGIIAQIYEPPLQYDYLKRPYELIPLTLREMPRVTYVKQNGKIVYTIYDLKIKPGIYYQPHPALKEKRELTAEDYVYQIKRLASPQVNSPIFGVMSKYIVGFSDYAKTLQKAYQKKYFVDLRDYPLAGVTIINKHEYQIKIHGNYPQFLYWLAMPFFSPMPYEADLFYSNPELKEKNITLDWYPIGTGPYLLKENNPNRQIVLEKNPYFHGELHPETNEATPQVEKLILSLDKESIPRWNKFLQGYYDRSGISADSFDSAIQLDKNGNPVLTKAMQEKGIRLETTIGPSIFYIGFNMLDDVVGGCDRSSPGRVSAIACEASKNKKLRQAIAIAIDYEEYIQLFLNGRGIAAHSPIPPGIFGYEKNNINKVIYFWDEKNAKRKPIEFAKKLLSEAGYPNGIDPKTRKALVLNYDVTSTGNPDDKAQLNWMRKQFAKLGIDLNIRHTEYNRFQEKVRTGNVQIFSWGWLADYPDPENFLFLLYSANGKVKFNGENATNYNNPHADTLFNEIKNMPNNEKRLAKIRALLLILQEDAPWIWGVHPIDFTLSHQWVSPTKPHGVANNTLKYQKINPALREQLREQWNKPILWPLWILLGFLILIFIPLIITYFRRENKTTVKKY